MYTYHRNRPMLNLKLVEFEIDQQNIWAAAVHAYNVNQGYFKEPVTSCTEGTEGKPVYIKEANRTIADNILKNPADLTPDVIEQGQKARHYLNGKFTFMALSGKINDYERAVYNACNLEKFTHKTKFEYAVVISAIASYYRYLREEEIGERINTNAPSIGTLGEKVELDIEVVKNVYSQNYGVNFVTGITTHGQKVFFSFRTSAKVGQKLRIKATIKAFRPDATQLNRAKIIDQQ